MSEKSKLKKVFVVGKNAGYISWIDNAMLCTDLASADFVMLTGGEDVSPVIYDDIPHPSTYTNLERDKREVTILDKAIKLKKPIVGICRGAQFICANHPKGRLIQHQENPTFRHNVRTYDGQIIEVTSTHHQAQFPFNIPKQDYKILAWTVALSKFHQNGKQEEMNPPVECEVVWYPRLNALGIQPHPELMTKDTRDLRWFQDLLNDFLSGTLNSKVKNVE